MSVAVRNVHGLAEAASALAAERGARIFGGGTLLMRAVNEGAMTDGTLIRVLDPALRQISVQGSRVELGAGVTMAEVIRHRDLAFLHAAARAIGGPAIRTMASVGGNLFAECPYGDFAVALLALDAVATLHAPLGGARQMSLEELLANRSRAPGLVASLAFARPARADAFRFLKASRVRPKGISVLSIAAHLPGDGGRIAGSRIAYGAMAPTPVRAKAVERALEGRVLDAGTIEAAKRVALEGTSPSSDAIASEWYRREVLPVHLGRLLAGEAR